MTIHDELTPEIAILEHFIDAVDTTVKMNQLTLYSIEYLHAIIFNHYGQKRTRKYFSEHDLQQNPARVLSEYPIVLSTTFSSRTSLKNTTYDYIIMDEASQVDLVTDALALSCARNSIIVGDLK